MQNNENVLKLPRLVVTPGALGCHKRWKVSPFVKFEKILPLLCFLLDALTNKNCKTWSLRWICGEILGPFKSKESCCQQREGLVINQNFQKKIFWGKWCCPTDHALLEEHDMVSQNS